MELCNSDLKKRLRKKKMTDDEIMTLTNQMSSASGYLQQNGVIHRDIKPGNILISGPEEAPVYKLGDFGSVNMQLKLIFYFSLHTSFFFPS